MAHLNFFADKTDKLEILDFIFNETDLIVYDLGSPYGEDICEYNSVNDIITKFNLIENDFRESFQLWSPRHKGKPIFRKIELNPKYCDGNTFRYATEGLGLMQLYFGGINKNYELVRSAFGNLTEKNALRIGDINTEYGGRVGDWDWKEIVKTSNKIKYHIDTKFTSNRIGVFRILSGAEKLKASGIKLR